MCSLQMSLYFAPAFFAHLLGRCLQRPHPFWAVTRLGATVIATFALCWAPFLHSTAGVVQVPHPPKRAVSRKVPLLMPPNPVVVPPGRS